MLKKVTTGALALFLALGMATGVRALSADTAKPAAPAAADSAKEKPKPGGATLEELGAKMCKAGETANADALIDLFSPPMVESLKQYAPMIMGEDSKDPWADFKGQIQADMQANPLVKCSLKEASEIECAEESVKKFEGSQYKIGKCGTITMSTQMKDAEEVDDEILHTMMFDGRWYMNEDM